MKCHACGRGASRRVSIRLVPGTNLLQCFLCDGAVPTLLAPAPHDATEAASPRRARAVLAAVAVLAGCAELPPERAWAVAYAPSGAAALRVELTGAIDRQQADEALQRRAIELGCAAPAVTVQGIAAKVEGEKTTTTVTGAFTCGAVP